MARTLVPEDSFLRARARFSFLIKGAIIMHCTKMIRSVTGARNF